MTALQQFHSRKHSLRNIELNRFELMDFTTSSEPKGQVTPGDRRVPKYSIIIYDYATSAAR